MAEGGKTCRTARCLILGKQVWACSPHLWNENTILPEGCCGTSRAVCLGIRTTEELCLLTHTQPFRRFRHSSQAHVCPYSKSVTVGKLFNLSLHWGPCIFRWGAGYLHQSCCGPWWPQQNTQHLWSLHTQHIPRVLCFFLFSSSKFCLLLRGQNLVNLSDMRPEQAFFWSGTLTNPGQHSHLHYRFFSVSGGKKIFCYPLLSFCTHCFSTEVEI